MDELCQTCTLSIQRAEHYYCWKVFIGEVINRNTQMGKYPCAVLCSRCVVVWQERAIVLDSIVALSS